MSRMVGPSRLLRRVFFEPLLSATKDSSIVLTIYSYRGTERSIRWKDIKSLMKSWTSLLSTATHQQTDSHHHSARVISTQVGGGFSMCWWRAYKCQSLPWTFQPGIKGLVCISALGFHLELCVYVCPCDNVFKHWVRLHSQQSSFGSNCPVHNIRQGFSNFLMQVPQIWSPCERKYKLFLKYICSYIK